MLDMHIDKDGNMKPIAAMDDQHLRNTIRMWFRTLRAAFSFQVNRDLDEFNKAFYGIPDFDEKDAGEAARKALKKLYPYLSEAFLRDMQDIRKELGDILGRNTQLGGVPALQSGQEDVQWLDYDDDDSWHPGHPDNFGDF